MSRESRLIRTINDFRRHYRQLGSGDVIIGVLALRPGEEIKVLDLAERGVAFFPRFWLNSSAAPRWPRPKSWGNTWFPGLS